MIQGPEAIKCCSRKVYSSILYIFALPIVLGREMASIKYQFDTWKSAFFPRPRSLEHSISISNTCISASFLPPFLRVPEKCSLKTFRPSLEYQGGTDTSKYIINNNKDCWGKNWVNLDDDFAAETNRYNDLLIISYRPIYKILYKLP